MTDPDAPRPRLWGVVLALLALYAGMSALGLFVLQGYVVLSSREILAGGIAPSAEQAGRFFETLPGFLLAATLSAGWMALLVLVAAALSPVPFATRLGLLPARLGRTTWIAVTLGSLAVNQAVDAAFHVTGFGRGALLDTMLQTLAGARGPALALALLVVGVLAAAAEELFFRGFVQRRLVARLGPAAGIGVTALVFGLVHQDVHHSLFAFAFGLFIGWAAWIAGSTWPAIVAHAINNTVSLLAGVLGLDDAGGSRSAHTLTLITSLVVLGLVVAWLTRRAARVDALDGLREPLLRSGA